MIFEVNRVPEPTAVSNALHTRSGSRVRKDTHMSTKEVPFSASLKLPIGSLLKRRISALLN